MKKLGLWIVVGWAALLPACTNQPGAYDQWRVFVESREPRIGEDVSGLYQQLRVKHAEEQESMRRLQLAYLLLHRSAPATTTRARLGEAEKALAAVDDEYALAPIRDAMLREAHLQRLLLDAQEQLGTLDTACQQARESLRALRLQHTEMQRGIELCKKQLEAMKNIENTISDPVSTPGTPLPAAIVSSHERE